jgi:hypothetical protein
MRFSKSILFLMVILVGALAFFAVYTQQKKIAPAQTDTALQTAIEQCSDITERAAAHLVAIVEFQRLEIIGRKARVFKMCMQDHGYIENPAWLDYSQSIVKPIAEQDHISIDEALENLRRTNMIVPIGDGDRPNYWLKNVKDKPKT